MDARLYMWNFAIQRQKVIHWQGKRGESGIKPRWCKSQVKSCMDVVKGDCSERNMIRETQDYSRTWRTVVSAATIEGGSALRRHWNRKKDAVCIITTMAGYESFIEQSWVEQGLTSHQTHYRSYRGRVFTGQMTQPTVSKHWRKTQD